MSEELLRVNHLKKYFKTQAGTLHAVDDVSFSINAGTTLGVVGESGCGKSTLGRTILALTDATDGEVFFDGENITTYNRWQKKQLRRRMQIIFQDPFSSLDPRKTVMNLIAEPLKIFKVYSDKASLEKRVHELMDTVGLSERLITSFPHELDGGRRQRIGVARAIALNPKFIVCDEPVSALDVSIQAQALNLLQDLQREMGLTYMFITHDMSVVKHISDEIMVMYVGCIVEKAPSKELFRAPYHPYTKGLLSAIPIPSMQNRKQRIIMKGEISSPVDPPDRCRFASRCPYATDICRQKTPQLEEASAGHFVACHNYREINSL